MFIDSDFDVIRSHLERACDLCLLTKQHCPNCNVERLLGILEGIDQNSDMPSYMVSAEELAVLTNPGSPLYSSVLEKWKGIISGKGKDLAV